MKKAILVAALAVLAIVCLTPLVCWFCKIKVTALSIKRDGVDRVDRVDGYYVAVYEQSVYKQTENGIPTLTMGDCSDVTDYDWKHEETFSCVPYKRFLCFAKEAKAERYHLFNEDKSLVYGTVFVVRSPKGTVHYYYTRTPLIVGVDYANYVATAEYISFDDGENEISLDSRYSFSSEIDFTTGEHPLYVGGERVFFSPSDSD